MKPRALVSANSDVSTTAAAANVDAGASTESLTRLFRRQREAFAADRYPDVAARRDRLERIADIVKRLERALVAAIDRDFGHRSAHETRIAELYIVAAEARHAIRNLPRWMKPRRVPSAARTSDCEPSSRGFSESSGGADDAIEIT